MIIGLGYKARSGKDTAADYLIHQHGYKRIAFADAVKRATAGAYGLTEDQVFGDSKLIVDPYWNATPASLLQLVGTELFRDHVSADHWIAVVMRAIDTMPEHDWVIPDVRFPNEAEAIQARGGLVIRVDREMRDQAARSLSHRSETSMDEFAGWDYILDNNGTLQTLYEGVEAIIGETLPVTYSNEGEYAWTTSLSA